MMVWKSALLSEVRGVAHGVSTRLGGVSVPPFATLNMGLQTGDRPHAVAENRRRLLRRLGFDGDALICGEQVHGNAVRRVERRVAAQEADAHPAAISGTDGLVTTEPGLALTAFFADCLPVLVADINGRAVGVAHAGWRGTIAGVAQRIMDALVQCGVASRDVRVALGPCIKPCCYEVSEELYERFRKEIGPEAVGQTRAGRPALDLARANQKLLTLAGVQPSAIEICPLCTGCRTDLFFSHRAERGKTGRFAAVIGLI